MKCFSDTIEEIIENSIENYDGTVNCEPFQDVLTVAELIDRLSIVNFKLFTLKNKVIERKDNEKFCAWAAIEDVELCKERSKLKNCINEKFKALVKDILEDKETHNLETKLYE